MEKRERQRGGFIPFFNRRSDLLSQLHKDNNLSRRLGFEVESDGVTVSSADLAGGNPV